MKSGDFNQTLKGIVSRNLKEYLKIYDEKWGFLNEPLMILKNFNFHFNILFDIKVLIYF